VLREQSSQAALESAAAAHGRVAGDEEHDVFGHQAEDGVDIARGCGGVPERDEGANGLFVRGHGDLLG